MPPDRISDRNPDLEEMKERGWAWVQVSGVGDVYGAPYTDDEYAALAAKRYSDPDEPTYRQELRIISFDQ